MTQINRRSILGASAAFGGLTALGVGASAAMLSNNAPGDDLPTGAWTPLQNMPFPVQEIYPTAFRKAETTSNGFKPAPMNILVNAGGLTPDEGYNVTDAVTFYDPAYDQWGFGTSLPEPRHHISLVANNGYLYGIGGFARNENGGWQMRGNCWRTGSLSEQWSDMQPMPHPQAESICQPIGPNIHVVGGRAPAGSSNRDWADHIDTDQHWLYDDASDKWFKRAPLPTPRNSSAGAVFNGALYVIGGRTVAGGNTSAVEVYDPLSDRWERARPMPKAQGGLAAAVLNRKIYVFGGEYFSPAGGGVFAEAWEYDPIADRWRAVAAMPRPRHGLGAVTLGNNIYVVGGAAKAGGAETSAALDRFEI
ncbi:MAG: hypothetical protein DHS20C05_17210 [Hyphococcus sp.]|nr:MAG: hypothetical protein DHS20C05_17210 [Marinicaulis sp.]